MGIGEGMEDGNGIRLMAEATRNWFTDGSKNQ
jgi:hypothetical protein